MFFQVHFHFTVYTINMKIHGWWYVHLHVRVLSQLNAFIFHKRNSIVKKNLFFWFILCCIACYYMT